MYRRKLGHSRVKNIFKFVSTKMNIVFKVESALEFDTCFHLEYSPDILSFEAQPSGFFYEFDGKSCPYTPDFKINHRIHGVRFLEIKPFVKSNRVEFIERFKVKRSQAEINNIPLILVTEHQIRKNQTLINYKLLQRYANNQTLSDIQINLLTELKRVKKASVQYLMDFLHLSREDILITTLNIASKGHLFFDPEDEIFNLHTNVMSQLGNNDPRGMFKDEFSEILDCSNLQNLPILIPRDLDSYPEHVKAEVHHRLSFLHWIQAHIHGGWTERNLGVLLAQASIEIGGEIPKWRTVAQWWSDYKKSDFNVTALIPQHHNKGNRKSRLNSLEESLANIAIADYLQKERRSITSIYEDYKSDIILQNEYRPDLKPPLRKISYSGLCKRIKKIAIFDKMSAREGKYKSKIEFRYIDTHIAPTRVLERVELDHTILNLILLDAELRVPLGRACLTLLIDCFSRCIIGFNLGFNEPGFYPVRNALLNAFKPKDYIRSKYPHIIHEWPCYGKPELIVVDNGAEFWGKALEQSCKDLNINVQYNPVRTPWLKPDIEGSFGIINKKLLNDIPGKTFASMVERYDYDPKKDAVMTFSVFVDTFHQWIIDDYHFRPDSREKFIPYLRWQEGIATFPPKTFADNEQHKLDIAISIPNKRFHRKGGIYIHSLRYDSEELAYYRQTYNEEQLKTRVLVKTNPDNISYINVFI
jgi:putative transposase